MIGEDRIIANAEEVKTPSWPVKVHCIWLFESFESETPTNLWRGLWVFGTPGETRTHYLTLRRRTLYPGELRGHDVTQSIVPKKRAAVNKTWENFLWEDKEYANIH